MAEAQNSTQNVLDIQIASLRRELEQFKELVLARLVGEICKIETRLDAMDKALIKVEKYPTDVDRAFDKLKQLHGERIESRYNMHEEKLRSIHELISERDKRAGFLAEAQKEAREKNESSLVKQLEALETQIATVSRVLDNKVDDLRTRIQVMEGRM